MALTCGVLWFINTASLQRKVNAVSPQPGPRLFFWNIGHVKSVPSAVHELLRSHDPDAAAFAEAENLLPAHHLELAGQHPGYQVMPLPGGMLCMVKGTVSLSSYTTLPQRSCVQVLDTAFTRFPGPPWRICLADVGPLPPLPRTPVLTEIFKVARGSPRTLVAADFNTPLDSAAFDEWRDNFHHAHADCPEFHGPLETWGFGLPVLAIDHLWLSPDLVPLRADKGSHFRQDHSWILVETGITPRNRDTISNGGTAN